MNTKKINLAVSPKDFDGLIELTKLNETHSIAQTIRLAISVYSDILDNRAKDAKVVFIYPNGSQTELDDDSLRWNGARSPYKDPFEITDTKVKLAVEQILIGNKDIIEELLPSMRLTLPDVGDLRLKQLLALQMLVLADFGFFIGPMKEE